MSVLRLTEYRSKSLHLTLIVTYDSKENDSGVTSGSQQRPHLQRWLQSWKMPSIMKKQLVHLQLLGNCVNITLASQGAVLGRFEGRPCKAILACGNNVWFTNSCSVVCLYCFITDVDGVMELEQTNIQIVTVGVLHYLQGCQCNAGFLLQSLTSPVKWQWKLGRMICLITVNGEVVEYNWSLFPMEWERIWC